ncbi:MAG: rhodanese-like domain-containing protein [Candidatus Micrarchaeia archaeon]
MNQSQKLFLACGIMGALVGVMTFAAASAFIPKSNADVYRDFYATETAVSVSPSDYLFELRAGRQQGLLVDLRTPQEYANGHLVTAINIPAGQMNETEIVAAFSRLPRNTVAINYCYSSYCMLSRKVGKALADNGIYAKHLTAGWLEIARDYQSYVVNGTAAGALGANQAINPLVCDPAQSGEFGC